MSNVDGKKFAFATVFRALALGIVVGAAVGVTALVAPVAIPTVALWSGVGAGIVLAGSLIVSVDAANREADIDWESRDLYETPKPSLWSKIETKAYDAVASLFSKKENNSQKQNKKEKNDNKQKLSVKSKIYAQAKEKNVEEEKTTEETPKHESSTPAQEEQSLEA